MITKEQFKKATGCTQALADKWHEPMMAAFSKYFVYKPIRMCHFLAQTGHESLGFTRTEESFSYSAARLRAVFPKYFTEVQAQQYAGKPEAIADRVYANRMGNGPEGSRDGYNNRGRGLIMITGANNYKAAVKGMGIEEPKLKLLLVNDTGIAAQSAGWWLWSNNGTPYMDDLNSLNISRIINFGTVKSNGTPNGMDDRNRRFKLATGVLL